jgi:glycine C-acetyltransferase
MFSSVQPQVAGELDQIRADGLFKTERVIATPQRANIAVVDGTSVLNMCANNYLGLADDPRVIAAAKDALDRWGYGLASVRFICGTQDVHKQLERRISHFLGTQDTILYSSCFDANGGLFETILGEQDVVISDELNHASIIDGIRLSKAKRKRYRNRDMADLEKQLKSCGDARRRLIATDGVFSMDGYVAPLAEICDLAETYDAMVMVDDSHAVGFVGPTGRGTPELHGVTDRVDIVTGTLGKALGGASGGYTSGRREIIDLLRQRSRPYLFSNSVAPAVVAASLKVLDLLEHSDYLRSRLDENTVFFREKMTSLGFDILPGDHPIVPVMIGDAAKAARLADLLLGKGIYVIGFSYPVVPVGKARIRTQVSAAHTQEDLERAATAFAEARDELAQVGAKKVGDGQAAAGQATDGQATDGQQAASGKEAGGGRQAAGEKQAGGEKQAASKNGSGTAPGSDKPAGGKKD